MSGDPPAAAHGRDFRVQSVLSSGEGELQLFSSCPYCFLSETLLLGRCSSKDLSPVVAQRSVGGVERELSGFAGDGAWAGGWARAVPRSWGWLPRGESAPRSRPACLRVALD